MAFKSSGTQQLDPDERAALKAKTALDQAQINELGVKARQGDEQLRQAWQEIQNKMTLGREDIAGRRDVANIDVAQRDRTTRTDALVKLLGLQDARSEASDKTKADIISEIARRPDINPQQLAGFMATQGQPGLQNVLNAQKADQIDAQLRAQIPQYQKASAADKLKLETAANTLDPNAGKRLSAFAYPTNEPPIELAMRKTAAPAPTAASVPAGLSTADVLRAVMGGTTTEQPDVTAPATTVPSNRLIQHGTIVGGPLGYDFNVNTGEYVPRSTVGMINGLPANVAINHPVYSDALAEHGIAPAVPRIAADVPAPLGIGQLVAPPPLPNVPIETGLTAPLFVGGPVPNPTPTVTPSATPYAVTGMTPDEIEAEKQRRLREALAAATR